jgi:hypothetical protein
MDVWWCLFPKYCSNGRSILVIVNPHYLHWNPFCWWLEPMISQFSNH